MRLLALTVAALATLPAAALADSGSIRDPRLQPDGTLQVSVAATADGCSPIGTQCVWNVEITQTGPNADCTYGEGTLWIGSPAYDAESLTDEPKLALRNNPTAARLCLFEWRMGVTTLLDDLVWKRPSAPAPVMSMDRARETVGAALARELGAAFTNGTGLRESCRRQSSSRVRCTVSWRYRRYRYSGWVAVWLKGRQLHYGMTIRRRG